jgi:hypothetical protein
MESILGDHRLERRDLGDLMEQGLGILTGQAMATTAAVRGLADERLLDLLGRDQEPGVTAMAGLSAASLAGRGRGRAAFDGGRIGRGGLGGVGGVLVEAFFEVSDPALQLADDPGDNGLGLG